MASENKKGEGNIMNEKIITDELGHGFINGDVISITSLDRRLWKRILHFITFQSPPVIVERGTVKGSSETTMTVSRHIDVIF